MKYWAKKESKPETMQTEAPKKILTRKGKETLDIEALSSEFDKIEVKAEDSKE